MQDAKMIEAFDLEAGQPDHVTIEKYPDGTFHATPFVIDELGHYDEMDAWYAMEHDVDAVREVRERSTVVGEIVFERNWLDPDEVEPI